MSVAPESGRLILVRHGRTPFNAQGRFQGQLDISLDATGIAQARAVARVLGAAKVEAGALVSSDLMRAGLTAAAIGAELGIPAFADPRLREIYLGAWQGLNGAEAEEAFPAEFTEWRAGHDVRRGGGETYLDVAERASACVSELTASYPGRVVVIVTHGGTVRALVGHLTGLPHDRWSALGPLGNCRMAVLDAAGERGWRLISHNSGDLP